MKNFVKRFLTIDWIAAALLWAGNYLLIYQKSWVAWAIFIVANLLWAAHWLKRKEWAALILVTTFIVQDILGILAWR